MIGKASNIKGFDGRADGFSQIPGLSGGKGLVCHGTDVLELREEHGMSAKQEGVGQLRFPQSPGGFRKTGGGEIKQAQFLEKFKAVHGGVKRPHEPGSRLEFKSRQLPIIMQPRGK